jgi:hypothetical protein
MSREKKIAIGIIVVLAALPLVFYALPYERSHYGCVQCRMVKRIEYYCGIKITREIPNECSQWYMDRHPDHEHEWVKGSCTYSRIAFSKKWSCGHGHNIFRVVPQVQKAFLSSCTPEKEAEWFELLCSNEQGDFEKAEEMAVNVAYGESASEEYE